MKDKVKKKLEGKISGWFLKNEKRVYFTIAKEDLRAVAKILYSDFNMRFVTATGIDNEDNFEIIYHFGYDETGELFNIRVFIEDKDHPSVDSLTGMFKASNWVEREIHEMLGINFAGHPDLKPLLLGDAYPENACPLRKGSLLPKAPYPLEEESKNNE